MATGSFAAIASYNGTGTQGLAVVDKIKDDDEDDVMSVFWNKTDTDKQILHGSNILEIPTSTSNKQGTWGGSQTFSVNPEVDCIGDIYLALNVDFNIPESSLVEEQYPRTITTLLQKPSDPNHEFLNNTQPVGYSLRGTKKGDTEPKSSIIGYQQGFKRDESTSYDSNGIPSAYSQNGYPNRGDGDDEHWMELPIQRKTLKGLRTYYDTNPSSGEEPNELVNTGMLSKSDSVHMTTVDTQVNQPHDNSGNILEGFNNWINASLIETANDNHLSAKVTDGPPPGRFPGVLSEEDANEIKHTGNEFLALDENGEFEIYKSEGVVASDLFKSYLNRNDIDNLVNYYNDNTTHSYPLESINDTSGLQDGEVKSITAGSFSINDQPVGHTDFNGECVAISEDGNTMAVGQGFTISRDGLVTAGVKDVAHNPPWNTYTSAETPYGTWSWSNKVEGVPIGHYIKRPDNLSVDDTIRHIGKVRVYKKKKGIWMLSGVLHPPKSTFTPPKRPGINNTIVPGVMDGFANGNTIFTDPSANGMTLEWTGKNQHSSVVNPDFTANTPIDLNAESTNFAGFTQGGLHGFTNNKYISINADGTRIVVAESNKNSGAPYNGWSGTFDYTETDGWKFINEGYVGRYSRADMDYKGIPGAWDVSLSGDGNSLASLDLRALAGNTINNSHACAPIEMIDYEKWKLGGSEDWDKFLPGDYDNIDEYVVDYDNHHSLTNPGMVIDGRFWQQSPITEENPQNVHKWKWAWFISEFGRRHRWDSNYDVNREGGLKTHSLSKSWARASLERILDSKTVPFSDFIRMRPRIGHRILQSPEATNLGDFFNLDPNYSNTEVTEDIPRGIKASNSGYMNSISFKDNGIKPSNPYEPSLSHKENFDIPRNTINTENQTNDSGTTFPESTIPFNHYAYFKEAVFPGGGSEAYKPHPCNVWIRYWDPTNHGPNKDNIGGIGYNESDRINGWVNHKVDYIKDSGLFGRGDKDIWHQYIYRKILNLDEALKEHWVAFRNAGVGGWGSPGYTGKIHDYPLQAIASALGLPGQRGLTGVGVYQWLYSPMAGGIAKDVGYVPPHGGDVIHGTAMADVLLDTIIPLYANEDLSPNETPPGYGEISRGRANWGYYGRNMEDEMDANNPDTWPAKTDVHAMNVNPNYPFNRMSEFQLGIWDPSHPQHSHLQNLDFKLPEIINLYIRNTYIPGEPERWAAKCVKMSSDGNRIVYITDAPTPVDRRSLPLETYSPAPGALGLNSIGGQITNMPTWPTPANCEVRVIEKNSEGNWVYMAHSSGDMYSGLNVPAGHEAIDMTMSSDGNTVAVYSKRPNLYPKWAWEETRRLENGKPIEMELEADEQTREVVYSQVGSNITPPTGDPYGWNYANGNLGSSIALSGRGTRVIIGAPVTIGGGEHGDNGDQWGNAYIYDWVITNGVGSWQLLPAYVHGDAPGSLCGSCVAINYDGTRFAVGSIDGVRVYESNFHEGSTPGQGYWTLDIIGPDPYGSLTGFTPASISMNGVGDRIVIGDPTKNGNAGEWKILFYNPTRPIDPGWYSPWSGSGGANNLMGMTVDMDESGDRVIIGCGGASPEVWQYDGGLDGVWARVFSLGRLSSTYISHNDSVSISADGLIAAVGNSTYDSSGVTDRGTVIVFELPYVTGVDMEYSEPSGSAHYSVRQQFIGGELDTGGTGEVIGRSVALNNDGNILSFGGVHYLSSLSSNYPNTGSIRTYLWDGNQYNSELIKGPHGPASPVPTNYIAGDPQDMIAVANLEPSAPTSLSSHNTLSISADGLTIAAGLPLKNPDGEARVFKGVYNHLGAGSRPGSYFITVYPETSGLIQGGVFYLNDQLYPKLNFIHGNLYVFTWPNEYPLSFSTTPDGIHNGGVDYIPVDGTNVQPDSKGGIYSGPDPIFNIFQAVPGFGHTVIRAAKSMPTLYYYCKNQANMGNRITFQRAVPWVEPIPEDNYNVYDSFINDGLNDINRGVGEPAITIHTIVDGSWTQIGDTIYPSGYHDTGFRHRSVIGDPIVGSETPVFGSPLDFIYNHWKYPRMKYSLDLNSDGSRLVIGAPMNIPEDSGPKTVEYNVDVMSSNLINPISGTPFINYSYEINDKIQPNLELVKLNTYKFKGKSFIQQPEFKVTLKIHYPSTVPSSTWGWQEYHSTIVQGHVQVQDYPPNLPGFNSTWPLVITSDDVFDSNHQFSQYYTMGPGPQSNYFDVAKLEAAGMDFSSEKDVVFFRSHVQWAWFITGEFTKRTIVYLVTKDSLSGMGSNLESRNIDLSSWQFLGQDEDLVLSGGIPGTPADPWKLYKKIYEPGIYEYEFNWDIAYHFYQESETQPIRPDPIIRFSTTPNGIHNSGVEYTKGVTIDLENNITTIEVSDDTPTLYYYSSQNDRMDGLVTILERTAKNSSDFYRTFNGVDEYIVPRGEVLVYDKNPDNTYTLKNRISKDDKHNKSDYSTTILTQLTGNEIPYTRTDSNGDLLPHSPYVEGITTIKTVIDYIGSGQDSGYRFGSSVSISGDGNTISIGAPETGVQTVDGSEVISGASDIANTFTYTATAAPTPGPKKKPGNKFAKALDVFDLINQAQKRSNYDITDFSNLPDIGEPINWKKQFKEVPEGAILPPELEEYDNPRWASSDLKSKVNFPLSKIIKRIEFTVGTQIWQILEHDDILAINATELPESSYRRLGLQSHGFLRSDGTRESTKIDNWIPGKSYQAVIPLPVLTKTIGGQLENFTQNTEDGYLSFLAKDQEVKVRVFYSNFEDIWDVNEVFATKGFTAPIYNLENKQRGFGQYITNAPIPWKPNAILTSKLFGKHFIMAKEEKEYFKNNRGRFGKNIISTSTPWKRNTIRTGNLFGKNIIMAMEKDTIIPKRVKTSQNVNKIFPRELYPDTKIIIDLDSFSLYSSHLIITSNFPSFSDKTKIPVLKSAELFLNSESFSGIMNASILKGITNKSLGLYSNEFNIDNLDTAAGNEYYVFPLASRAFGGSSIPLDRFDNIRLELIYTSPNLNEFGIEISEMANINVTCRGEMLVTYKDGVSTIKLY